MTINPSSPCPTSRKLRQFSLTIDPNLLFLLKYSVFFRLVKNNDYMIVGANFLCMCFCKDFFINKISKFSLYIILYMKWNRSLWLSVFQSLDFFLSRGTFWSGSYIVFLVSCIRKRFLINDYRTFTLQSNIRNALENLT